MRQPEENYTFLYEKDPAEFDPEKKKRIEKIAQSIQTGQANPSPNELKNMYNQIRGTERNGYVYMSNVKIAYRNGDQLFVPFWYYNKDNLNQIKMATGMRNVLEWVNYPRRPVPPEILEELKVKNEDWLNLLAQYHQKLSSKQISDFCELVVGQMLLRQEEVEDKQNHLVAKSEDVVTWKCSNAKFLFCEKLYPNWPRFNIQVVPNKELIKRYINRVKTKNSEGNAMQGNIIVGYKTGPIMLVPEWFLSSLTKEDIDEITSGRSSYVVPWESYPAPISKEEADQLYKQLKREKRTEVKPTMIDIDVKDKDLQNKLDRWTAEMLSYGDFDIEDNRKIVAYRDGSNKFSVERYRAVDARVLLCPLRCEDWDDEKIPLVVDDDFANQIFKTIQQAPDGEPVFIDGVRLAFKDTSSKVYFPVWFLKRLRENSANTLRNMFDYNEWSSYPFSPFEKLGDWSDYEAKRYIPVGTMKFCDDILLRILNGEEKIEDRDHKIYEKPYFYDVRLVLLSDRVYKYWKDYKLDLKFDGYTRVKQLIKDSETKENEWIAYKDMPVALVSEGKAYISPFFDTKTNEFVRPALQEKYGNVDVWENYPLPINGVEPPLKVTVPDDVPEDLWYNDLADEEKPETEPEKKPKPEEPKKEENKEQSMAEAYGEYLKGITPEDIAKLKKESQTPEPKPEPEPEQDPVLELVNRNNEQGASIPEHYQEYNPEDVPEEQHEEDEPEEKK